MPEKPDDDRRPARLDVAALAELPTPRAEAALHVAIDELSRLGEVDPLEALDGTLDLMQRMNAEILKCYAPALLAAAQDHATAALSPGAAELRGTSRHISRQQAQSIGAFAKLQETVLRLGVAQVKIRDELQRRARARL